MHLEKIHRNEPRIAKSFRCLAFAVRKVAQMAIAVAVLVNTVVCAMRSRRHGMQSLD